MKVQSSISNHKVILIIKDMVGGIFTQLGEGRGNSSSNDGQGSTLLSPVYTEKGSQIFNNT